MGQNSKEDSRSYLTIEEYKTIAKKILFSLYGPSSSRLIKDDDIIGSIISELIIADWKWDGRGKLYGYRKIRVKWAINKIFSKNKDVSTNMESKYDGFLESVYDYKQIKDIIKAENNEQVQFFLDAAKLTKREKICLEKYYLGDMKEKMGEIGAELGISRQAVDQNIKNGIAKIKKYIA